RFGSTNEIGVFEMGEDGMREVQNPSEVLLAQRPVGAAGSVVTAALEGTRPLLVEVQALVGGTSFTGLPRRQATGLDHHRVHLILAVLEERAELALANRDIYVSVAGGVRVEEPAADLGIALAVASSLRRRPVNPRLIAVGELGLAGEVRSVQRMGLRLWEASRLGFEEAIVPRRSLDNLQLPPRLKVKGAETIQEAIELAWGGKA
ncbi:MAG: magnesium chelatase domain-containing protein, partial [Bacillota bacterium]|nr:magnesium chelatase domain-containing protein [Bacillota bacterium]